MKYRLNIPESIKSILPSLSIKRILDYGTGKGGLVEELKSYLPEDIQILGYDPGVEKFSSLPDGEFDLITCIDVLEHIDKYSIHSTFQEIKKISKGFVFFAIDLIPAQKKLLDGRNAHITLAPSDWWCQQLKQHFRLVTFFDQGWLEDETSYPVQLFGCATNDLSCMPSINQFIETTRLTHSKWIYDPNTHAIRISQKR